MPAGRCFLKISTVGAIDTDSGDYLPPIKVDSIRLAKDIVRRSDAVGAAPLSMLAAEIESGQLVALPTRLPWMTTAYGFVYLRDRMLSPAAEAFMAEVRRVEAEELMRSKSLTASFEKFILDVEMLQMMMEFLQPMVVDEASLGFEAIRRVPTGGHFFGDAHTMERYGRAFYQPLVSNWQNFENWELAGARDATQRATETWQRALQEYEQPTIDPAVREELEAYAARRREQIGAGEP